MNYFLMEVFSHNAQVFVDGTHRDKCNQICEINFKPNYIPLMMEHKEPLFVKNIINEDEINIAILGRIVPDKVHAINNVINQANNYKTDKKIIFHIIGDGVAKDKIKTKHSKKFEVRLCGVIKEDELDDYLLKNIDVLFAMGTSVLNGAALGIPSYIIPTENKPFNFNEFVFLPFTTDLITGFYPNQKDRFRLKTIKFEDVIEKIYINNQKYELGQQCYEYVNKNFTASFGCEQFKKALNDTTLSYTTVAQIKNIQEVKANAERKLPLKYKILDKIWRHNKRKTGDFKKLKYIGIVFHIARPPFLLYFKQNRELPAE